MAVQEKGWWKRSVVYQIYPRSFYDTNGDGIGDLQGIIRKLDYIKELGANVIWLSPIYRSPMDDNGYDISDYLHVDPSFGSDEDMDQLIVQAQERGIKIILDMVVNHCSDEHEWFQKAKKDPEGRYGKYFYIQKGADGQPPNNWRSIFGGSAWERIESTPYHYLHLFTKKQVDLNWENKELREEIYKVMDYWLDKGIAGFRMDAITYLKKAEGLPSFEADSGDGLVSASYGALAQKGILAFLTEMRDRTYGRYNAMTVGEASGIKDEELIPFISEENGCFSMIFDFSYCELNLKAPNFFWHETREWSPDELKRHMFHSQKLAGKEGWFGLCIENHDMPRAIDHYLPADGQDFYGASMLATMYMMLRGVPYIYQGQEIGMRNCRFETIEAYDDCSSKDQYNIARKAGHSHEDAMGFVHAMSRDNARTPFQWSDEVNAGFTSGTPWLEVNPDHDTVNAKKAMEDPASLFHWYQALVRLRLESGYAPVLTEGGLEPVYEEKENLIAYKRTLNQPSLLILCNFQGAEQTVVVDGGWKQIVMDNHGDICNRQENEICLRAYEAVIMEI